MHKCNIYAHIFSMDSFGQRLKQKREEKGLTQQQLADLLGKGNKTVISSWEKDKNEPSLTDLKNLAVHLNTTVSYLLDSPSDSTNVPEGYLMVDAVKYSKMLEQLNEKKDQIINEQSKQLEQIKNR